MKEEEEKIHCNQEGTQEDSIISRRHRE